MVFVVPVHIDPREEDIKALVFQNHKHTLTSSEQAFRESSYKLAQEVLAVYLEETRYKYKMGVKWEVCLGWMSFVLEMTRWMCWKGRMIQLCFRLAIYCRLLSELALVILKHRAQKIPFLDFQRVTKQFMCLSCLLTPVFHSEITQDGPPLSPWGS